MLAVCACTHSPRQWHADESFYALPPPPPRYSAAEVGAMFDRPTNAPQLLRNLKIAVDSDLYYSYTDQATEDWLLRFAPNERKNVRFVIALPKPGLQQGEPHGLERRLAIYDGDEIDDILIYIPEP
jgi:hypothetical protein